MVQQLCFGPWGLIWKVYSTKTRQPCWRPYICKPRKASTCSYWSVYKVWCWKAWNHEQDARKSEHAQPAAMIHFRHSLEDAKDLNVASNVGTVHKKRRITWRGNKSKAHMGRGRRLCRTTVVRIGPLVWSLKKLRDTCLLIHEIFRFILGRFAIIYMKHLLPPWYRRHSSINSPFQHCFLTHAATLDG